MNLEQELIESLRREEPDPGFSSRVMHRIHSESGDAKPFRRRRVWQSAAALVLVAGLAAGVQHRIEETRKRELAHAQLQTALRITASKLEKARQGVLHSDHAVSVDQERNY